MCGETRIPIGICVWGNTRPYDTGTNGFLIPCTRQTLREACLVSYIRLRFTATAIVHMAKSHSAIHRPLKI